MNTIKVILISAVTALVVIGGISLYKSDEGQGSVQVGSEYSATTTVANAAGLVHEVKNTTNSSFCVLGSVVIASSSDTTFEIRDATSTTDVSSTTIATFPIDAPAGTYTFDVACTRGIGLVVPTGYNGTYVITYR